MFHMKLQTIHKIYNGCGWKLIGQATNLILHSKYNLKPGELNLINSSQCILDIFINNLRILIC